jgi:hypothetical protein
MNIGHEDDALKPYIQPSPDFTDEKRLGKKGDEQVLVFGSSLLLTQSHWLTVHESEALGRMTSLTKWCIPVLLTCITVYLYVQI